jgi:hypothetical protein
MTEIQPNNVHAQSTPRLSNNGCAMSGSAAADSERMNVFEA